MDIKEMNVNQAEHLDAVVAFARQWTRENHELLAMLGPEERTRVIADGIHARFYNNECLWDAENEIVDHAVLHSLADFPVR